ncbi:TonB-dependent receptor [Flagellimonas algicola]|uniref:Carboxypeptidase regulatory-like domain-containing protein n=1 Tax=Flagellimonas algicola TaxID=2583815 RepID=A0ABY2WKF8_9FLAO|nr:TonB-dependent receptor [Allomuricauda algicola]TMU55319.1 carboxypeptidase regulatory-like domain-containing protein [Allomuricauda algicola]
MRTAMFFVLLCYTNLLSGQHSTEISGTIKDGSNQVPVARGSLKVEGFQKEYHTAVDGSFTIALDFEGDFIIHISAPDYLPKTFELFLEGQPVSLGDIFLEKDITLEKNDNLITLTDNELSDDEGLFSGSMGMLQSTRDIFLTRAAFDFGQAFFKIRGYDSQHGEVLINGIPLNKIWDGRPQWNNWGGLNDVIRNQTYTQALEMNPNTFGGILGNTNIDTRPSGFRSGLRVSSSMSNRTYRSRLMATYNSGLLASGWAYSLSASRRWANSGYVDGTLYDAQSLFGTLEYKWNKQNSLVISTIMANNRRGRSAALTDEVFVLMGNRYNPYWGIQNGEIRNSRERRIFEPLFMVNHFLQSNKMNWTTGIMYQSGSTAKDRLAYFNTQNPDPTYYKYVPSFHINGSFGADFVNANLAKEALLDHPQLDWGQMYAVNRNSPDDSASYALSEDVQYEERFMVASNMQLNLGESLELGLGANMEVSGIQNFSRIKDLLGAEFLEDSDSFSLTRNDVFGNPTKTVGDRTGYNFEMNSKRLGGFTQLQIKRKKWNAFVSGALSQGNAQRNGLFQNERYPEYSLGKGDKITLAGLSAKSGMTYFLNGRHWIMINGAKINRAPALQNLFVNPRENNVIVPEVQNETISTIDLGYHVRLPDLKGRISAFYTRFQHTTDVNFFFVDSGLGSDFVQEVITGLDKLHKGLELGLEFKASNELKLSLAGNLGSYVYASDPNIQIYFDTSGNEEDLINKEGNVPLGTAKIKGLKLAQGPQTALSFGVEYRSPKYWWLGTTANYMDQSYANLSTIKRTQSFLLDPDTQEPLLGVSTANVDRLLKQQKLEEIYLLNLVGGKSWLVNKKYISAFLSVNNVFDSVFKTGGYEQSRNGNYQQMLQDNLSGTPSFGTKYWRSYGRTYFLNLAINF